MSKVAFRHRLHEVFCLLFRITIIPWFLREIYARHKVTIINYHNPNPKTFKQHLSFYVRNYSIISMDRLAQAILAGQWSALPKKPLVISFDDGYIGNKFLFDALEQHRVPAIMYLVAGAINTNRRFWFNVAPANSQTMTKLETIEDSARRDILRSDYFHTDQREYTAREALNTEEINRFIAAGGILGAHTMSHPVLTKCPEKTAAFESEESKKVLEQLFDCNVHHFAYPHGIWNSNVRECVHNAGFTSARATTPEWVTPDSDILVLPSFGISDDAGLSKAIVQSCGLWALLKKLSHHR